MAHKSKSSVNGDQVPILTDRKAAALLGTTWRVVRRWVRKRQLPGRFLPDGTAVIALADLVRWVEAGKGKPVKAAAV